MRVDVAAVRCAQSKILGQYFVLEKRRLIEQIPFVAVDREFVRRRRDYQYEVVN